MKDRRPRKLKKTLKRRFEKVQALRTVQVAMVTMGSALQMAGITARPNRTLADVPIKAIRAVQLAIDTKESISKIMNTGPKNWREA